MIRDAIILLAVLISLSVAVACVGAILQAAIEGLPA